MTVHEEIASMYAHCKESVRDLHGPELMEELDKSIAWMARTGEVLSDALEDMINAKGTAAQRLEHVVDVDKWGATRVKAIVEGEAKTEIKFYKLVERLSAMLVHRADALRTMISYTKAQRTQYNQGGGGT